MWKSVCLTIIATAGNNIGKVLQKSGTLILPPLTFKFNVLRAYISNITWITGFLMDISGAGLLLLALSEAPVSVVQPVSGCGLAILSVFSHFYLKEIMNAIDWIAIALAAIGTIGNVTSTVGIMAVAALCHSVIFYLTICVGAGAEEQNASSVLLSHLPRLALIVAFLFILLNGWLHVYKHKREQQELVLYEVVEEIIYGVESGILFGISSVISKTGFLLLKQGFAGFFLTLCISLSVLCSTFGFYYQTRGLKHGRAIVVTTCGAVSAILTAVLSGMYALGEDLPSSPISRQLLLVGWVLIVIGVSLLVFSSHLARYLLKPRGQRSGADRRASISNPTPSSAVVIQASSTTLHHLLSSKEKP